MQCCSSWYMSIASELTALHHSRVSLHSSFLYVPHKYEPMILAHLNVMYGEIPLQKINDQTAL